MRTVFTRFFPFSQDQTPIWNEFWYDCNISLQAKCWPAIAGHSLPVTREQKISQTSGQAFPNPSAVRVCLVKPKPWETSSCSTSPELPPWCTGFWDRKAFCSQHTGGTTACPTTPPPPLCVLLPLCCRIIHSRWEVNMLCFLFLLLLCCLLVQFTLTSISYSLLLQTEVSWPFSVQKSNSCPCSKWRAVFIAEPEDWDGKQFIGYYLASYQALLSKDLLPWKAMERIPVTSVIFGQGLCFLTK